MRANITQPGRSQQRVDDGMTEDIAIAVTLQTVSVRNVHAAEYQGYPHDQGVSISAGAYSILHPTTSAFRKQPGSANHPSWY
jgi:hypothetical protein